MTINEQIK